MQTFIFGRNKQRLHEEHLGNFLRGSIRLAGQRGGGGTLLRAHVSTAVSQKFRFIPGRTQWKSSNIRVEEEESVPWGTKPSSAEVFSQ